MANSQKSQPRVAFQGEHGAFSEAAAIQLLGDAITTVPRATFDSAFRAIDEGMADALLAPVENSLAGSVVDCRGNDSADRTSSHWLPGRDSGRP